MNAKDRKPKGKIIIVGGGEELEDHPSEMRGKNAEYERFEIVKELLRSSRNERIEIITSGTRMPEDVAKIYDKTFREMGYKDPGFMHIMEKDTEKDAYLKRVENAGLVFFTGGVQERLIDILGETKVIDIIKRRYQEDMDFVVAGTSAGAMIMSKNMIKGGGQEEALIKGDLKMSPGLGLLENCIIDTHFIKRGRFGRLAMAVAHYPQRLGLGLGEDTALAIKNGNEAECYGSGAVTVISGQNIGMTNVAEAEEGNMIFIQGLKVDILSKGCKYWLDESKFILPS